MNRLDQWAKRRQQWVECDSGRSYLVQEPSLAMFAENNRKGLYQTEILSLYVVDWKGVTVGDIDGSDNDEAEPFNQDLFAAFIGDWPDEMTQLIAHVSAAVEKRQVDQDAIEKKSNDSLSSSST